MDQLGDLCYALMPSTLVYWVETGRRIVNRQKDVTWCYWGQSVGHQQDNCGSEALAFVANAEKIFCRSFEDGYVSDDATSKALCDAVDLRSDYGKGVCGVVCGNGGCWWCRWGVVVGVFVLMGG